MAENSIKKKSKNELLEVKNMIAEIKIHTKIHPKVMLMKYPRTRIESWQKLGEEKNQETWKINTYRKLPLEDFTNQVSERSDEIIKEII